MRLPLDGLVVVDLGHRVAAPLAAMLLADQGATVIRIHRPGDRLDRPLDRFLDRGKQRVALDLTTTAGRDGARALLATADVAIESYRPGVVERLGVGPSTACAASTGLIYVSMPGFASSEPRASIRATDGIVGAATGLYTDISAVRPVLGLGPVYTALPLPSVYAGIHAALATVMAAIDRASTSRGQAIEVPLASAAMSALGGILFDVAPRPWRYDIPPVPPVVSRVVLPVARSLIRLGGRRGHAAAVGASSRLFPPLMANYRCSDGRLVFVYALDHARFPVVLLDRLGLLDRLQRLGLTVESPWSAPRSRTNLCDSAILGRRWQRVVRGELARVFATRTADDWETALNEWGIPCAIQRSCDDWVESVKRDEPSLLATGEDGSVQPGPQVWFTGVPRSPIPACREVELPAALVEAERVRAACVPFRSPVRRPEPSAGILAGLRVLDLSSVIAGPACGRTLAEYGADVIKIDPPAPLQGLRVSRAFAMDVSRGKSSVMLDLKVSGHRAAFDALLAGADVVVHNFRDGALDRLELGRDAIHRRNPGLVCARVSAYGAPGGGRRCGWPGFDPVVQAASGIMVRFGTAEAPELHAIASCLDFLTGYSAAYGVGLALLQRGRDPERRGVQVETSLAQSANLIQAPFVVAHGRAGGPAEPSGQGAVGPGPLERMYRARDGWVFVAATDPDCASLARLAGDATAASTDAELAAALERSFRRRPVAELIIALADAGIAAHPLITLAEIRRDHVQREPGDGFVPRDAASFVVVHDQLADARLACAAPAYARFARTQLRIGAPPALPGADTRAVLTAAGIAPRAIDEIEAALEHAPGRVTTLLPG